VTPKLTEALTQRIVRKITEGIPAEVSARLCGISLDVFAEWMMIGEGKHPKRRATPRFKAFAQAIDQAEAQAVARKVTEILALRGSSTRDCCGRVFERQYDPDRADSGGAG